MNLLTEAGRAKPTRPAIGRQRVLNRWVLPGHRPISASNLSKVHLSGLHLVHQCTNQSCAIAVARYLVVYLRPSGADPQSRRGWKAATTSVQPYTVSKIRSPPILRNRGLLAGWRKSLAPANAIFQDCFTNTLA